MRDDATKYLATSIKEVQERRSKTSFELKDGERRMIFQPGFDLRNTDDRNYGQGSPTLTFAERRGNVAIDCSFGMGWNVKGERSLSMDGRDISVMGYGFYYHRRYKKDTNYPEYAHQENDCALLGHKKCWGEAGSALYGDVLKWKLMNFGEAAIWEELDNEFKAYGL